MGTAIDEALGLLCLERAEVNDARLVVGLNFAKALEILDDVLSSPSSRHCELAAASYRHRNGFAKLVCGMLNESGPRIRLHVWPQAVTDAHIHDHSWAFRSLVLWGEVGSDCFKLSAGRGSYRLISVPNLHARNKGLEPRDLDRQASLRLIRRIVPSPGESYGLRAGEFHRVHVEGCLGAATLVLQARHVRSYSRIALAHDQQLGSPYPGAKLSRQEFVDILVEVMQVLRRERGLGSPRVRV
jgi:hypothetical protein